MNRSGEATYSIGLTLIAPPDHLREWFDHAPPGDVAQWASGPSLGVPGETHRMVDGWESAGAIKKLPIVRCDGKLTYRIERLGAVRAAGPVLSANARLLLFELMDRAPGDGAIPGNDELAEWAGLPSAFAVRSALAELEAHGRLRVEVTSRRGAAVTGRRVEFLKLVHAETQIARREA